MHCQILPFILVLYQLMLGFVFDGITVWSNFKGKERYVIKERKTFIHESFDIWVKFCFEFKIFLLCTKRFGEIISLNIVRAVSMKIKTSYFVYFYYKYQENLWIIVAIMFKDWTICSTRLRFPIVWKIRSAQLRSNQIWFLTHAGIVITSE